MHSDLNWAVLKLGWIVFTPKRLLTKMFYWMFVLESSTAAADQEWNVSVHGILIAAADARSTAEIENCEAHIWRRNDCRPEKRRLRWQIRLEVKWRVQKQKMESWFKYW